MATSILLMRPPFANIYLNTQMSRVMVFRQLINIKLESLGKWEDADLVNDKIAAESKPEDIKRLREEAPHEGCRRRCPWLLRPLL